MEDYKVSFNKKCPCPQKRCPIRGNCVLCVQNHIDHKVHIPKCMQNLIKKDIQSLCKRVELETEPAKLPEGFWENFDSDAAVKQTLAKHKN